MARPPAPRRADLQGAGRLAVQGTLGLVDLIEAMHARIERLPGLPTPKNQRSGGLTGLVYGSVRGVTRLVGGGAETLLSLLPDALDRAPSTPRRDAVLAALNGVLGDQLAVQANPLAIAMTLRSDGETLALVREALARRWPDAGPDLLVLVHGLCMNDRLWHRQGHDHGAWLARELGLTPIYLNYNTGLPVAENGRQFAALLSRLHTAWPARPPRIRILAHSMGGLVTRSAFAQAGEAGWTSAVSDFVCLGTPHFGSPLERAGHGIDLILNAAPYAAPLAQIGELRSAGITDLRHGLPLEPGLPGGPRCWAVAGSLGAEPGSLKQRLLGDGLVSLDSAFGHHADPARRLGYDSQRCWIARGAGHLDLLSDSGVAQKLLDWLQPVS